MATGAVPFFRRCSPIRCFLFNAGAFVVAAFLTGVTINRFLPSPPVAGLTQKFEYLAAHPEVDTVFVGSSRVFHAFDPRAFDRATSAGGRPTCSFNFGLDGMRPPESYYVLREVLKHRPPALRRVFIELVDLFPKVSAANLGSARYHHWHDWRHTCLVLRQVAATREPLREKVAQAAIHLACFAIRTSNLGRGPEPLQRLLRGPGREKRPANPWEGGAGYAVQPAKEFGGPPREVFDRVVASLRTHDLERIAMPRLCASAVRDLLAEVRAAGVEPIFVLSPTIARAENFTNFADDGIDAPLIAFNDPRRFPALFDPTKRADHEHLNAAGAADYTRALAEEFLRLP